MATQISLIVSYPGGKVEVLPYKPGMKIKVSPGATYSLVADGVLVPTKVLNDGKGNAKLQASIGQETLSFEIQDYYRQDAAQKGTLIFTKNAESGQIVAIPASDTVTAKTAAPAIQSPQVTTNELLSNLNQYQNSQSTQQNSILSDLTADLTKSGIAQTFEALTQPDILPTAAFTNLNLGTNRFEPTPAALDQTPPEIPQTLNANIGQRVLRGRAEANATVLIQNDQGAVIARVPVAADGSWALDYKTTNPPLPEGISTLTLQVEDAFGNVSQKAIVAAVVDTVAPNSPTIDEQIDTPNGNRAAVDTAGGATSDRRPIFKGRAGLDAQGQAEPGIEVSLFDRGVLIGKGISDENGVWTIQPTQNLAEGTHVFTVIGRDSAGNDSPASSLYPITVDTRAPTGSGFVNAVVDDVGSLKGDLPNGSETDDLRPMLSGRSSGRADELIAIFRNGVSVAQVDVVAGRWQFTEPEDLAEGSYQYVARVIDRAGNQGPASDPFNVKIDTTKPDQAIEVAILTPDGVDSSIALGGTTKDRTPIIQARAEPGARITVRDDVNGIDIGVMTEVAGSPGRYTFTSPRLSTGALNWTLRVIDKAGNEGDGITVDFNVQTIGPPQTVFIDNMGLDTGRSNSDFITSIGVPNLNGESRTVTGRLSGVIPNDTQLLVYIGDGSDASLADAANWQPAQVSGRTWFYTDPNTHTANWQIRAKLVDVLGNEGDSLPIQEVTLDQSAPAASSGTNTIEAFAQTGILNIEKIRDAAGVDVEFSLQGTSATQGDQVQINWGSQSVLYDLTQQDVERGRVSITIDEGTILNAGSAPALNVTGQLLDKAGNFGALATIAVVNVDVSPPEAPTIDLSAGQILSDGFLGSAEQSGTVSFTLNGAGDAAAAVGDKISLSLFNRTSSNTTALILSPGAIGDDRFTYTLTAADVANGRVQVQFPNLSALADDNYVLRAQLTDTAGNSSADQLQADFVLDRIAPNAPSIEPIIETSRGLSPTITSGGSTRDPNPVLSGQAEAFAKVSLLMQGSNALIGEVQADKDGNWSYAVPLIAPLTDGAYSWYALATDRAGNVDNTQRSSPINFTIAAQGPTQIVAIESMDKDTLAADFITNDGSANRIVRGTISRPLGAGDTLQVSVDGGTTWQAVIPVFNSATNSATAWDFVDTTAHSGNWSIQARIIDTAGIVGLGAARQEVVLDTMTPTASTTAPQLGPESIDGILNINDLRTPTTVRYSLAGTDAAVGDTLALTFGAVKKNVTLTTAHLTAGEVTSSFSFNELSGLIDGEYRMSVQLTDIAGNVGPMQFADSNATGGVILLDTRAPLRPEILFTDPLRDLVINAQDRANNFSQPYRMTVRLAGLGVKVGDEVILDWGQFPNGTPRKIALPITGAQLAQEQVVIDLNTLIETNGGYSNWSGASNVSVYLLDKAGNKGRVNIVGRVDIDVTAPVAPTVSPSIDTPNGTTPSVNSGGISTDPRPIIKGTGEPNALIAVFDGRTNIRVDLDGDGAITAADTIQVDGDGNWQFQPAGALTNGLYSFAFQMIDPAGNVGPISAPVSFSVNSQAPLQLVTIDSISQDTGVSNSDFITAQGSGQVVRGRIVGALDPGVSLRVEIDGQVFSNPRIIGSSTVNGVLETQWEINDFRAHTDSWNITGFLEDTARNNLRGPNYVQRVLLDVIAPAEPRAVTVVDNQGSDVSEVGLNLERSTDIKVRVEFDSSAVEVGSTITVLLRPAINTGLVTQPPAYVVTAADKVAGVAQIPLDSTIVTAANVQGDVDFFVAMGDLAGNSSTVFKADRIHIDTVAPVQPVIDDLNSGNFVNKATGQTGFDFSGTAEPNSTITLEWNQGGATNGAPTVIQRQDTTVGSDGRWSITIAPSDIPDEVSRPSIVSVIQTDSAGNASSVALRQILIATVTPVAPTLNLISNQLFGDNILNFSERGAGQVISGTGGQFGSTVRFIWDNTTRDVTIADQSGNWQLSLSPSDFPADAAVSRLSLIQLDQFANVSPITTHVVAIDTQLPSVLTVDPIATDNIVNFAEQAAGVQISGLQAEAGAEVFVKWNSVTESVRVSAGNAWSVNIPSSDIPVGSDLNNTVTTWQVDSAGNESVRQLRSIRIDTSAPNSPTIDQNNIVLNAATAANVVLTGNSEPNSRVFFVVKSPQSLGAGTTYFPTVDTQTGQWQLSIPQSDISSNNASSPITNGINQATLLQQDSAGNLSIGRTFALNVDTIFPTSPLISNATPIGGADGTINALEKQNGTTLLLAGVETGALGADLLWQNDQKSVQAVRDGAQWKVVLQGTDVVADAASVGFVLRQTDSVGNVSQSSAATSVRIDTTAPDAPTIESSSAQKIQFINDVEKNVDGSITVALAGIEAVTDSSGAIVGNAAIVWNGITRAVTYDSTSAIYSAQFFAGEFPADTGAGTPTRMTLTQSDSAGNVSVTRESDPIFIDTIPPAAPTFGNSSSASGILTNAAGAAGTDKFISSAEKQAGVTIVGQGEAGSTVEVSFAGESFTRTTIVDAAGNWAVNFGTDIPSDTTSGQVNARLTDTAGNISTQSTLSGLVIDAAPPAARAFLLTERSINTAAHGDGRINLDERNAGVVLSNSILDADIARVEVTWGSFTRTVSTTGGAWAVTLNPTDMPQTEAGATDISVFYFDASGNKTINPAQLQLNAALVAPTVTLDYTVPSTLGINTVAGDNIINLVERNASGGLTVSGVGEAGAQVNVGWGASVAPVTVTSAGTWQVNFNALAPLGLDSSTSPIVATQTDTAGNIGPATTRIVNLDTQAPSSGLTINTIAGDDRISNSEKTAGITLNGLAEANASVAVQFGSTTKNVTANSSGVWRSIFNSAEVPTDNLSAQVIALQTDTAGNVGTTAVTRNVSIDTALPPAPTIFVVASDGIVNNAEKTAGVLVSGTAESNARLSVTWGTTIGTVVANSAGNWSRTFTSAEIPADGNSQIVANQTDTAGNVSQVSQTRAVVIDTLAPNAPNAPTINLITADDVINANEKQAAVTLSGTAESNATVSIIVAGVTKQATVRTQSGATTWNAVFNNSDLPTSDNTYPVTVVQTDLAGNVSNPVTRNVDIDTTVASASIVSAAANTIVNATEKAAGVSFTGNNDADAAAVNVIWAGRTRAATIAGTNWNIAFATSDIPADSDTRVTVLQTDDAGNVSTVGVNSSTEVRIDTAVAVPIVTSASDARSATGAAGAMGSIATVADNFVNAAEKAAGFVMRGTAEGSSSGAGSVLTLTWNTNPNGTGTASSRTVTANNLGAWSANFAAADFATDGVYTVNVVQTDTAGNVSLAAARTVTVDTEIAAPVLEPVASDNKINAQEQAQGVTVGAFAAADVNAVQFVWAGQTYQGSLNSSTGRWSAFIPSSAIPTGNSAPIISVIAIDAAGNRSAPTTRTIDIDTTPPQTDPVANFQIGGNSTNNLGADNKVGSGERLQGFGLSGTGEVGNSIRVELNDGQGNTKVVNATVKADGTWFAAVSSLPVSQFNSSTSALATVIESDSAGNSVRAVRQFVVENTPVTHTSTSLALDTPDSSGALGSYSSGDKINFTFSEGLNVALLNGVNSVDSATRARLGTGYQFSGVGQPDDIFIAGLGTKFTGLYEAVAPSSVPALIGQFGSATGSGQAIDTTRPVYKNGTKYIFALQGGGYVLADLDAAVNQNAEWFFSVNATGSFTAGDTPIEGIAGWLRSTAPSTAQIGGSGATVAPAVVTGFFETVQLTLGTGATLTQADPIVFNQFNGTDGIFSGGGNTITTATLPLPAPRIALATPHPTNSVTAEDSTTAPNGVKDNSLLLTFNLATSGFALADLVVSNGSTLGTGATLTAVNPVGGFATQWRVTFGTGATIISNDTITIPANRLLTVGGVANPAGANATFTVPDIIAPEAVALTVNDTFDGGVDGTKNSAGDFVVLKFTEGVDVATITPANLTLPAGRTLGTGASLVAINPSTEGGVTFATEFRLTYGTNVNLTTGDSLSFAATNVTDKNGNKASAPVTFVLPDIVAPGQLVPPLEIAGDNRVNASERSGSISIPYVLPAGTVVGDQLVITRDGVEIRTTPLTVASGTVNITLSAADWGAADGTVTIGARLVDAGGNKGPEVFKQVEVDTVLKLNDLGGNAPDLVIFEGANAGTNIAGTLDASDRISLRFGESVHITPGTIPNFAALFGAGATLTAVDRGVDSSGNVFAREWVIENATGGSITSLATPITVPLTGASTISAGVITGGITDLAGNNANSLTVNAQITPTSNTVRGAPKIGLVSDNNVISVDDASANPSFAIDLAGTNARAGDTLQLKLDGADVRTVTLTAADISANSVAVSFNSASDWGGDGVHNLGVTLTDSTNSSNSAVSFDRTVQVNLKGAHWSASQTVGGVTTGVLWFDPDTLLANGDVTRWNASAGGNSSTFMAPTTAARTPSVSLNTINGHNTITFLTPGNPNTTGVGDFLQLTGGRGSLSWLGSTSNLVTKDITLFSVTRAQEPQGQPDIGRFMPLLSIGDGVVGGYKTFAFGPPVNGTSGPTNQLGLTQYGGRGGDIYLGTNTYSANVWTVLTTEFEKGRTAKFYSSDALIQTVTNNTPYTVVDNNFFRKVRIGGEQSDEFSAGGQATFNGQAGDQIFANKIFTTAERQEIETYLAEKYRQTGSVVLASSTTTIGGQNYVQAGDSTNAVPLIDQLVVLDQNANADRVNIAGADYVRTGAGDDTLRINDLNFRQLDGGTGQDVVIVNTGISTLNLSNHVSNARNNTAGFHKLYSIEAFNTRDDSATQRVILNRNDVRQLSDDSTLRFVMGATDILERTDETQWNSFYGRFNVGGTVYTQKFVSITGTTETIYVDGGLLAPTTVDANLAGNTLSVVFDSSMGDAPLDFANFSITTAAGAATGVSVTGASFAGANSLGRRLDLTLSGVPTGEFIVTYTGEQITEQGTTRDSLVKKWYVGNSGANTLNAAAETTAVGLFGGAGNNVLTGGSNADQLSVSGAGNNVLTGGSNAGQAAGDFVSDTYVLRQGHTGNDRVTDFDRSDRLDLRDLLSGYDESQRSNFLRLGFDGSGKLRLSIDADGVPFGQSFSESNSVLLEGLDGITFNGAAISSSLTAAELDSLLGQLINDKNILL